MCVVDARESEICTRISPRFGLSALTTTTMSLSLSDFQLVYNSVMVEYGALAEGRGDEHKSVSAGACIYDVENRFLRSHKVYASRKQIFSVRSLMLSKISHQRLDQRDTLCI